MKPDIKNVNSKNIVDFIGSIFERRGGEEYLGEPVTMGQHMLQGATMAEQSKEPDDIIIGALLHDIGHFTSEFGTFSMEDKEDRYHEDAGAAVLEHFSQKSLPIAAGITSQQNAIYAQRTQNIFKSSQQRQFTLLIFKVDQCPKQK